MINKQILAIFTGLIVVVLPLHAQNKDNAVLLKTILNSISEQHQVNFNYIEEEIAIFKIQPPSKSLQLKEKLAYISEKTQLQFQFISDKYISIVNNKNLDKPLCGYLLDEETQLPISQATILIIGTTDYAITDDLGYFELKTKSVNPIEISHLNYKNHFMYRFY